MAFDAGSIVATMGLNMNPFAQGMMQAQSIGQLFPSFVQSFLANPLLGLIDMGKRVGESMKELAVELFHVFEETTGQIHELGNRSNMLGVDPNMLRALEHLGKTAGIDDTVVSLTMLSRAASDAASGEEAAVRKFAELGVVAAPNGVMKPLEELLSNVADAMAKLPNQADRIRYSMDLFGRSGAAWAGILKNGSSAFRESLDEMKPLGDIFTPATMEAAHSFDLAIEKVLAIWEAVKVSFAAPLAEALTPMLKELLAWLKVHGAELSAAAKRIAESVVGAINAARTVVTTVTQFSRGIAQTTGVSPATVVMGTVGGAMTTVAHAAGIRGSQLSEPGARKYEFNLKIEDDRSAKEAWRKAEEEFKKRSEGDRQAEYERRMIGHLQ